jgi:hypothetical protein
MLKTQEIVFVIVARQPVTAYCFTGKLKFFTALIVQSIKTGNKIGNSLAFPPVDFFGKPDDRC